MRYPMRHPRLSAAAVLALVCAVGTLAGAERSSVTMARTAQAYLSSLNATQKGQVTFPFEGEERTH